MKIVLLIIISALCAAAVPMTSSEKLAQWDYIVTLETSTIDYLFPISMLTIWAAVLVWAVLLRDPYITYVYTSFAWLDFAIGVSLQTMSEKSLAVTSPFIYCATMQYVGAFYTTIATHFFLTNDFPPGMYASILLIVAFVTSILNIAHFDAVCGAALPGLAIAFIIGLVIGVFRVVFYYEVTLGDLPMLRLIYRGFNDTNDEKHWLHFYDNDLTSDKNR